MLYVSTLCNTTDVTSIPISAHTPCSMSRLISEMAVISRLRSSVISCGRSGSKAESLTYPHKKNEDESSPPSHKSEMDYRIDVCRVTKGGNIEHLWGTLKKRTLECLFPSVGRLLQTFSPFKCTDFVIFVGEL
jgi:hypothetical protein